MALMRRFEMVPKSSLLVSILLVTCSCVTAATVGYDISMINGLNILPAYSDYFSLTTATLALNTASIWVGSCLAGFTFGTVTDRFGRKPALFWAATITLAAVILQTAAQNVAMLVIARILIGYGTGASDLCSPAYLAETLPFKWRGWGLGVLNDFYYVGGLIAAGVTYATSFSSSTWAWRAPSAVQGVFSIICILLLPFLPESPYWLAYHGRTAEALVVVGQLCADGDTTAVAAQPQFREIVDAIARERETQTMNAAQIVRTPGARKRIGLAVQVAVFSTISGNLIAAYYLGIMLTNAGITDTVTQLEINIILNVFCLICSLLGTWAIDVWGRKPTAILSTGLCTVFIFMVGALTKEYGTDSTNKSGIYATVASIFLLQGGYSLGWTPLLFMYPPEVLNYSIRANGMGVFTFALNGTALMCVFAFPFALAGIGWKTYMINGAWDALELVVIAWTWVETKGRTLEEVDALFESVKHHDAPSTEEVDERKGDEKGEFESETERAEL